MTAKEFKVGDRVKYTGTLSPHLTGFVGTVKKVEFAPLSKRGTAKVLFDGMDYDVGVYVDNLSLTAREIENDC